MATFVQLLFNGLALGAAYALVALGFVLVVNATGAVNFGHGDLVMAGGYAAVVLSAWLRLPLLALLPLVAAVTFLLGVGICCVAYFPLIRRPPSTVFISTLLCGVILENGFIVAFGPQAQAGPPLVAAGAFRIGSVDLGIQLAATILVAAALVGLQYLVFFRSQVGRRLRAVSEDRDMARALGIPALALIATTFGLGSALAGIAGAILANQFFVSPGGGVSLSLAAYIAVVIGGWGSILGAVLGAVIIALFQVLASAIMPYTAATACLYAALLLILFVRPQGIFGERVQRRL